MGRGGTNLLWSSGITCIAACLLLSKLLNLGRSKNHYFLVGVMHKISAYAYKLITITVNVIGTSLTGN